MRQIVVACAIALAAGCDEGPTGPTVDVRISGRVLDFGTNAGVPSATVALGESTTVTSADGSYSLVIPYLGTFPAAVDSRAVGSTRVTGPGYRGDLIVYPAICVARYGTVTDARTLRPIKGATVELAGKRFVSEIDGWYRLDLGCSTNSPLPGLIGIGTTFIRISHPECVVLSRVAGKGVSGAYRTDYVLQPQ
jgi:hypothetical protein